MRVTLDIEDDLIARAKDYTGIITTTEVIHQALKALIAREAALRLARLGGTRPDLVVPPRRRFGDGD